MTNAPVQIPPADDQEPPVEARDPGEKLTAAEPDADAVADREVEPVDENVAGDAGPNPGKDGPLLDCILSADLNIAGKWRSFTLEYFDDCILEISKDKRAVGKFHLHFKQGTDAGSWDEKRTAEYADGVLTLNKTIDLLDGTNGPYKVLYAVRANGTDFLVSDVNSRKLTNIDQLKQGFAYQRVEPRSPRIREKNPLKRPKLPRL